MTSIETVRRLLTSRTTAGKETYKVTFSQRGKVLKIWEMMQRDITESTPQYHINIKYDNRQAAFPHSSKWMSETTFVSH